MDLNIKDMNCQTEALKRHRDFTKKLKEMGSFDFLDSVEGNHSEDQPRMEFPYGCNSARPYGWFLK